jgi:hypothetical protein
VSLHLWQGRGLLEVQGTPGHEYEYEQGTIEILSLKVIDEITVSLGAALSDCQIASAFGTPLVASVRRNRNDDRDAFRQHG